VRRSKRPLDRVDLGEFFEWDLSKGPKPTPEKLYQVHLVADERVFQVMLLKDGKGPREFEDNLDVSRRAELFQEI
jgi:hypothetical protein